jgi:hypothetical protein
LPAAEPDPITVNLKIKKQSQTYNVTVLSDPNFDASAIDVATVCFGDAEDAGQRDCTEIDGVGLIKDVDRDKDPDMTLQFEAAQTGIDAGDTQACILGETTDGTPFEGCGIIAGKKK